MYNERIESLISAALTDGVLTEKEKQILFKRAEEQGIDLDEFEMVLDARLYEKQKDVKATTSISSSAPQSNKFGDIKKCPACGAIVQSFQTQCVECGYKFSNIEANSSIAKLFKMLDDVEATRKDQTTKEMVLDFFAKGTGLGGNKTDIRKKEIIKNFPIPTTQEDILEFLALAVPNARQLGNWFTKNNDENAAHNEFVPVWKAKCEQIIMKARFSMKDNKELLAQINEYAKQLGIK